MASVPSVGAERASVSARTRGTVRTETPAISVTRALGQTGLDQDLDFKTLGCIVHSGIPLLREAFGWPLV